MQTTRQDLWSGLALICLALVLNFYLIPTWVGDNTFGGMSPQFFPRFGTILIGLGGLALTLGAILKLRNAPQTGSDSVVAGSTDLFKVGLITVAMVGFILLFQWFGYLYATPPFLATMMVVFGARRPVAIILVSGITTAVLFGVFSFGLNLPLS
ncbi:MAG: tripartite tricarboxylate transporter TctB family protein [Sulfitobacter sp.]